MKHGFLKVAAGVPETRVADPGFNAGKIIALIDEAKEKGVKVLVLPELCLTGSTCGDLFLQSTLLDASVAALLDIVHATADLDMLVFVGMPVDVEGRLYSAAAAVYAGDLMGFIPRTNVAGTRFCAPDGRLLEVQIPGLYPVGLSTDLLFSCRAMRGCKVAVQFAADGALPVPPAAAHCAAGATVIAELSGAPMFVFSNHKTAETIKTDSSRLKCGWIYAAPGSGESTTDKAYSGFCAVVENGEVLTTGEETGKLNVSELDIEYLLDARRRAGVFTAPGISRAVVNWGYEPEYTELTRQYSKTPFVPDGDVDEYCRRLLDIQAIGVIKRMEYTGLYKPVIGVSGGVDSTLVMLSCARALEMLGKPKENLIAVTMPCFGTTDRTKSNAITIAEELGATLRIIPIGDSVLAHFKTIDHDPENHNVVFENAQARERTMCLMDIANEVGGLDIGTKDLSEQADGWTTFNGDQISNYDINAGLTKTMVKAVVRNYAAHCENATLKAALLDIDSTPVTPELLPIAKDGELIQKSEDSVGPYILQDFFTWHLIMRGGSPEKVLRLAEHAFGEDFSREEHIKWLRSYCKRFFVQQYKRSTSADGPDAVGFTLSPRDGHKMPSDASDAVWLSLVDEL